MTRLRAILAKGLEATEPLWPDVRVAFGWVHRVAAILRNKKGSTPPRCGGVTGGGSRRSPGIADPRTDWPRRSHTS